MKKYILILSALTSILLFSIACDKETIIQEDQLPKNASEFIQIHFEGTTIAQVEKEKEGLSSHTYDVILKNGTKIKFDKNGNWLEVDALDGQSIATDFIHTAIKTYLNSNYKDIAVQSIEKDNNRFEVELVNGLDLLFNLDGNFIRIDN